MYFPYLRGKQEETLAVLEANFLSALVVPIFEPTNLSKATRRRWSKIANRGSRFAIIANSGHGRPAPPTGDVMAVIDDLNRQLLGSVYPALELRAETSLEEVQEFAKRYSDQLCVLVHRNHILSLQNLQDALGPLEQPPVQVLLEGGTPLQVIQSLESSGKVLLRDGFERHTPNRLYPSQTNFDDLLFTFTDRGFQGFGDFTIVGDTYSPGGGAAKHVAIHLTECLEHTVICNHFVSSTPPTTGDVQAKYFSALERLMAYTGDPPTEGFNTQGVAEYHQSNLDRHYPGLGKLKRWSMLHHFEIIDGQLQALGNRPFI